MPIYPRRMARKALRNINFFDVIQLILAFTSFYKCLYFTKPFIVIHVDRRKISILSISKSSTKDARLQGFFLIVYHSV